MWQTGKTKWLVAELLLCAVICPPYCDWTLSGTMLKGHYEYSLDMLVNVLSLARGYLFYRGFAHYSTWTSEAAQRIYRKDCGRDMTTSAGFFFTIKAELCSRPFRLLATALVVALVYFAVVVRRFELYPILPPYNTS